MHLKNKSIILLFLLPLMAVSATIDPCLQQVRLVFDKLNQTGPKICYISYEIKAQLNAKDKTGKNIINASTMEIFTTDKKSWFKSKEMEVYHDNVSTVTILPAQKKIYIHDAIPEKKADNPNFKLTQLQDTIFKYSKKVECVTVTDQKYNKMITIYLDQKMSQYMGIKKVVYYINSINSTLHQVFIEYLPEKQYKTIEYEFTKINYDYKNVDISKPVIQLVLAKKNKLKTEYKDYQLLDVRKGSDK